MVVVVVVVVVVLVVVVVVVLAAVASTIRNIVIRITNDSACITTIISRSSVSTVVGVSIISANAFGRLVVICFSGPELSELNNRGLSQ